MLQGMLRVPPRSVERRQDDIYARMTDFHTVLRLAVVFTLGSVMWAAVKTGAQVALSDLTYTSRAADVVDLETPIVALCLIAAALQLPRLIAAIAFPFWRWNRLSAKAAVGGAWLGGLAKGLIAFGSITLGDHWITLQYVGDALFCLLGSFVIAIILNTDLKWEQRP